MDLHLLSAQDLMIMTSCASSRDSRRLRIQLLPQLKVLKTVHRAPSLVVLEDFRSDMATALSRAVVSTDLSLLDEMAALGERWEKAWISLRECRRGDIEFYVLWST
jgi:hypothetical protein